MKRSILALTTIAMVAALVVTITGHGVYGPGPLGVYGPGPL